MPIQPVVLLVTGFTLFSVFTVLNVFTLLTLFFGGWLIARWPAIPTAGRVTFSLVLFLCFGYLIVYGLPI